VDSRFHVTVDAGHRAAADDLTARHGDRILFTFSPTSTPPPVPSPEQLQDSATTGPNDRRDVPGDTPAPLPTGTPDPAHPDVD
jgi:hypothetical protein